MQLSELRLSENILVTGAAGFIGSYLCHRLLSLGYSVVGVDNINSYYDVSLKHERLCYLKGKPGFTFVMGDISNKELMLRLFAEQKFDRVIHLAAQAGVRYSIENPDAYISSNIVGFYDILESCRKYLVQHLVYASSSSVYGSNVKVPFEESDNVDHPVSLYAATKKSNELMAHTYSHLYKIPATGLRFFTVYGPMGRPDMAYFSFANQYFKGEPIRIFNNGDFDHDLYRDFTYIDDIIEGIVRLLPEAPSATEGVPHRVLNIGNNSPEKLMTFIFTLEKAFSNALGRKVEFEKIYEPIKPGDVPATYASIEKLQSLVGFKPQTPIEVGLQKFADWYVEYYKVK
ncbi:UDP-N-acetylglucosamine 4-epimerase [bioreactor metagenome]|uniref:UDP-N-acetylglucosamine 4-epimerase n=1 Tax=bioreactor metagenome TaxID=1076179 RepID=A0A644YXH3_9ZZZZ